MGAFGGLILTNKGRTLQAKAQAGATLNFNRIGIGDGSLSGQSVPDLNALISEKKSLAITKLKIQSTDKAVVGTVLSNQDIVTGFYFREIGVFAQDPDVGEILYCYGNAGAGAEYIPAGGGPDIVEKAIDVVTIVGNASSVTATIDESLVFATVDHTHNEATPLASGLISALDKAKLDGIETGANNYTHPATHLPTIISQDANNRFVTDAEKAGWDSKAEGNHSHTPASIGAETPAGAQAKADAVQNQLNAHQADYTLQVPYGGTTNNIGNDYSITIPAISALNAGMAISIKINADSTGTSTLNWDGKGAKAIKKANGTDVTNLKANGIYTLRYDGANFILQGEGASGNATASDLLSGKTATVDAGEITGTLTLGTLLNGETEVSYEIDTDEVITAGDLVDVINGKIQKYSTWKNWLVHSTIPVPRLYGDVLTENSFVVWSDSSDGSFNICTINGGAITVGIAPSHSGYIQSCFALNATQMICVYKPNSTTLTAELFNISGTTATLAHSVSLVSGETCNEIISSRLSDISFIVTRENGFASINAWVCTVSGSTITAGASQFVAGDCKISMGKRSIAVLTPTLIVVSWAGYNSPYYGFCRVLSIDGTSITRGDVYTYRTKAIEHASLKAISPTKFLIVYSYYIATECVILNVGGITISQSGNIYTIYAESNAFVINLGEIYDNKINMISPSNSYANSLDFHIFNMTGDTASLARNKITIYLGQNFALVSRYSGIYFNKLSFGYLYSYNSSIYFARLADNIRKPALAGKSGTEGQIINCYTFM